MSLCDYYEGLTPEEFQDIEHGYRYEELYKYAGYKYEGNSVEAFVEGYLTAKNFVDFSVQQVKPEQEGQDDLPF